jgi:hypothetical protein
MCEIALASTGAIASLHESTKFGLSENTCRAQLVFIMGICARLVATEACLQQGLAQLCASKIWQISEITLVVRKRALRPFCAFVQKVKLAHLGLCELGRTALCRRF